MWRSSVGFAKTVVPCLLVSLPLVSAACDKHELLYDDAVGGGGAGTTSSESSTTSATTSTSSGGGGAGGAGGQGGAGGGTCDPCASSDECAPGACAMDGATGCASCFDVCDGSQCQGAGNTCVSDADCAAPDGRCVCDAGGCTLCVTAL